MFYIKNTIFLYLTPRQKSALISYLRTFVKKNENLSTDDIIDKFYEDEIYYKNMNNPHFEFVLGYFSNDDFLKDLKIYINSIFNELKQKERLKPILEKHKQLQKEQKKKFLDYKMSKMPPTKKQLFFYDKITKTHNIKKKDTTNASRLDIKNWIMEIIEENEQKDND